MVFLFVCAAGELSSYTKSVKFFGANSNEKEDFMKEDASFLETIMLQCLKFNWRKFLMVEENSFLRLNCMKIFFRSGLYADPMFPCFDPDDLELAASSAIMHNPTDVMAVQDASIPIIYKDLYSNNSHFVATYSGSSSYGEVTENGVDLTIEAIKRNFLSLLSPQERRSMRLIEFGSGLCTTNVHFFTQNEWILCWDRE
jgi:hypothetical protein